jgi:hypothetical protein
MRRLRVQALTCAAHLLICMLLLRCRMKAEAMRDDENVFDVAFEGMGGDEPSASAADVKVRPAQHGLACSLQH